MVKSLTLIFIIILICSQAYISAKNLKLLKNKIHAKLQTKCQTDDDCPLVQYCDIAELKCYYDPF